MSGTITVLIYMLSWRGQGKLCFLYYYHYYLLRCPSVLDVIDF